MVKVKVIKRYSDVRLRKIQEIGAVLEVSEERAKHLVSQGVAVILEEKEKPIAKADEKAKGK